MTANANPHPRGLSAPDFQTLFETAPGLFLVLAPDLSIVAASDLYLRATMTSREDLLGKSIFEAFPDNPDDPDATGTRNLRASLLRVLRSRAADSMAVQKYDIRRPDSEGGEFEERFWSPVNSPVLDARGELAYIIHRVEDVTQFVYLKQQEDQQHELAAELRRQVGQKEMEVFERAQEMQGINQRLREVNVALQSEIAERKRSEARTAELAEQLRLLNEGLESRVAQRTAELAAANRALTQEMAARHRAQDRFRAIFNQTFELMCLLNTDGTIVEANQPALDFRGLVPADVVGRLLWETPWTDISDEARAGARQAVVAAADGEFIRREMTVRDAHGAPRVFDFSVKPVVGDSGLVELLLVEARDITDQKRLEEQFHQSQKMEAVGQLAGGVAHDFNNLLTIITGYSEMVLESLTPGDSMHELLEEINKAAHRSAALTRQLLAFSRKQVLASKVLDLNEAVRNTEKMLARVIGEDITLTTKLPTVDPVKADPGQLEQVLLNLAINARDAMPQGGDLIIETKNVELDKDYTRSRAGVRPGRYVLLCVTDSGQGMSAEVQRRLFEPFFTTKEMGQGTGLGLAVVHGIVKQSDGHIQVYSELGAGAAFKIYLPAVEKPMPAVSAQVERPVATRGTETILLVEDEESVRALGQRALVHYGYTVLAAGHPADAIRISQSHEGPIDLLLTDVVMPQMNGRRLVELLAPDRPEMKVLYMSGYTDDAIMRQGILDSDVSFLHKPFAPAALAIKVREVLDE